MNTLDRMQEAIRGYIVTEEGNNTVISKECKVTGQLYTLKIPTEKYIRWRHGKELCQNVFPDLSDDEREFLISGTTPEEWSELMGEES